MTTETVLIIQVPRDGAVDRSWATDPPPSIASAEVAVSRLPSDAGSIGPPQAGEVVMSVLSPEALTRDQEEVREVVRQTADSGEPLVILVEAAEYLREDELAVVLDAAVQARRLVILRVMADA
jgi:hypothetical protein